jgi:hypothetical protein
MQLGESGGEGGLKLQALRKVPFTWEIALISFTTASFQFAHVKRQEVPRSPSIRRCHDQSQISTRFDGNHTVDPYIRHQWLPDLSKTRARCGVRSTSAKTSNEIIWSLRS